MTKDKISQKLPSKFEIELIEFQRFVIGLRGRNKYSLSPMRNADETEVFSTSIAIIP
jgi:cell division septal protein FtsQ